MQSPPHHHTLKTIQSIFLPQSISNRQGDSGCVCSQRGPCASKVLVKIDHQPIPVWPPDQDSRQSLSSTNPCLTSWPGLLSCQKQRRASASTWWAARSRTPRSTSHGLFQVHNFSCFPDHNVATVEFYETQVELLTDTVVSSVETSCSVSTGCVAQFTKDLQSTNTHKAQTHKAQRSTKHKHTQVSVEGEHHEKAVELLKAAPASVKLVVRYTPKVRFGGWWPAGDCGDVDNRDILVSDFASFPSFCHSCKDINFLNNSLMLTIENIGQNRCKDLSKNEGSNRVSGVQVLEEMEMRFDKQRQARRRQVYS